MTAAKWTHNQDLQELKDSATTYDDDSTTYDDSATYYDGYDPTGETNEEETPTTWAKEAE